MFLKHFLGLFLFLGVTFSLQDVEQNKIVATQLNAKWAHTPLLLEAAEYMSEESPASFWTFVEDVARWDVQSYISKNDEEKFADLLSTSSKILSSSQLELLQLSLALRVHSPKVEMFRQIALDRGLLNDSNIKQCPAVIDVDGQLICGAGELQNTLDKISTEKVEEMAIYDVDHHYPGGESNKVKLVLYAEIGTPSFSACHSEILKLLNAGQVDYILRPYVLDPGRERVRLSGYGVELAIKSTEYKAQDDTKVEEEEAELQQLGEDEQHTEGFVFSTLRSRFPDLTPQLADFKKHLVQSSHDMAPMKVWQLQHLSMQAAQRVLSAGEPQDRLTAFINTAQDFPRLARGLTRIKVDDKMKKEIIKNQNYLRTNHDIGPNDAALFINGMHFDMDYTDIFTLLDNIKNEQRAVEGLSNLGVSGTALSQLLSLEGGSGESMRGVMGGAQPSPEYGLDIRDTAIVWLNDIENDSAYRRWPSSVNELLRPSYPGMLRSIRKNFHNLVLLVDPVSPSTAELFTQVNSFLSHNAPLRMGLVFSVAADKQLTGLQDPGVAIVCAFNYVVQSFDGEEANMKGFSFLQDLYSSLGHTLTVDSITSYFKRRYKSEDINDVFGDDSDFDVGRRLAREFIEKGGFKTTPQALMNGVPLPSKHLSGDEFEEVMLMEVMRNTQVIQRAVYRGELTDRDDVTDWLMAAPNIMPRLNDRILNSKSGRCVDTSGTSTATLSSLAAAGGDVKMALDALSLRDVSAVLDNSCHYISTKVDATVRPLTLWVVADYDTVEGRDLLLEAVKYTRESDSVRLCAVHHRNSSAITAARPLMSRIVQVAQATLPSPVARQFLVKVLDPDFAAKLESGEKKIDQVKLNGFDVEAFESRLQALNSDVFALHSAFSARVAGVPGGSRTVIANGRVLGPLDPDETFVLEDFALLEKHTSFTLTDKITEIVKESTADPLTLSSLIMKVSGVLQSKPQTKTRTSLQLRGTEHSTFTLEPRRPDLPSFDVVAVCDPVSLAAQKMGPVLQMLHRVLNAKVMVVLNAVEKHSEMPLKSFYRVVLDSSPHFDPKTGVRLPGPGAVFSWLPESPILTQNLHVPDNWLVEVVRSKYDLDNIKLELVETNVISEYELENVLVEGHCFEQSTGNPPRGLQFTLGTQHNPIMVDTIVMANLGYFQLKANPGAWHLDLREGRSKDLYGITSHEGTDTPVGSSAVQVLVSSFRSHVVKVRVAKLPGKTDMDLLDEDGKDGEGGGLWNTITSTFSSGDDVGSDGSDTGETINIFSVASGHLYERFLRIMMVSVRKHTNSPVKFWFLKNFLSPSLKDSLPVLAQEYGFAYELVQYKWPRWLHRQTEKQRIIWGYKILFLDVLFPLHVKKIIFVDADQVVRADIKELHDLNLEGAPYGFVPFCDSRKEMEGFRFWKHGYWRNHLGGRKYHISALFVVDLRKFRRIAAGDRLRGQYQGLSQDPNSLSNLDQDLPNNMIHQVRIKSLPMEWLWCETWCDDDSKKYAKVIDVCNNPQTKEAKLVAAERIIDEWTEYDQDIKRVLARHKDSSITKTTDASKTQPSPALDDHVEL